MAQKIVQLVCGAGVCVAGLLAGPVTPVLAQERGGRLLDFSLENGVETVSNADLAPGASSQRSQVYSDLGVTVASRTPTQALALTFGARARSISGDGMDDGFDIGEPRARLSYSTETPSLRFRSHIEFARRDLAFLNASHLIEVEDGDLVVPGDITDITGTGQRDRLSFHVTAQFNRAQPFNWGLTLAGTDLSYKGLAGSTLADSNALSASLNAGFALTPMLKLNARLTEAYRDTAANPDRSTTTLGLVLTASRTERLSLHSGLRFANPDVDGLRTTLSAGLTYTPSRLSQLSFDAGATFSDDFNTQFVGRFSYRTQPTPLLSLNASFRSEITDTINADRVLSAVAVVGATLEATKLSSISLDASFVDEERLGPGSDASELTASIRYNRQLGSDWNISVGASTTRRTETGLGDASSERLFLTLGRTWEGRF